MAASRLMLLFLVSCGGIHVVYSVTDPSDVTALQALKNQWENTPPNWGKSDDPCGAPWDGVTCNNSRVISLYLSNMGLKGPLGGDIGGLRELNTLILQGFGFTGNIPDELGNLKELNFLALNLNNFTGGIPPSLGNLSELNWLDVANNQLIGSIPVSTPTTPGLDLLLKAQHFDLSNNSFDESEAPEWFSTLRSLTTLIMEFGSLEGPIPQDLFAFPQLQRVLIGNPVCTTAVELSSTRFHSIESTLCTNLGLTPGSISLQNPFFNTTDDYLQVHLELFPSSGKYFNRSEIQRIGFDLCSQPFLPPAGFGPYYFLASPYIFPDTHGGTSASLALIIGVIIACAFLVIAVLAVGMYAIWQKKRAERAAGLTNPFASWCTSGTNSGSAPQLKGARWFTYDELRNCTDNFSKTNLIGSGGFGKTEVKLLSRVHHKNLVSLVGFCFELGEQMLVYEFMANGSLKDSLSGKSGVYLDWKRRLRIALGSTRGLAYLHELANPPIIHRDVKSSNILLDDKLNAKFGDFGLGKLVSDGSKGPVSTQVKGTMGYLDPEYYLTQQLTEKSDVYSFGVVMLELLTAKQPIEKGKYIVREVQTIMDKNDKDFYGLKEMLDPTIKNLLSLTRLGQFIELAMLCVEETASKRPTMGEVVKLIETILQNDDINASPTSASSFTTDFFLSLKAATRHPYDAL
ncbi:hypothetical protein Ancab_006528 [Ancistrocladus abbreviatus]